MTQFEDLFGLDMAFESTILVVIGIRNLRRRDHGGAGTSLFEPSTDMMEFMDPWVEVQG